MRTLTELRRALKAIGFGVRTQTLSFGRSATYYHTESKKELRSNCFSADQLAFWQPLLDFRKDHKTELQVIRQLEDITGLV